MVFLLISIVLTLAYSYFMYRIATGFAAYDALEAPKPEVTRPISIIIPFRNEAPHLNNLFFALDRLSYPASKFEVIFIDDHSTDASADLVLEWIDKTECQAQLLTSTGLGKKQAQAQGIAQAKHELIVCTDADCEPPSEWLNAVSVTFEKPNIMLAFGPVAYTQNAPQLQRIEFMALIASTMSMLNLKWPVMGNAANMAFRKDAYEKAKKDLESWQTPSGDDTFLLHAIGKNPTAVGTLNTPAACVKTFSTTTIWAFIQQRLRWASKAKFVSNKTSLMVGGLIFSVNAFLLLSFLLFVFGYISHKPFFLLFIVKFNIDFTFIRRIAPFFSEKAPAFSILIQELLNMIYVTLIGIFSQFLPYTWKGRRY